MRGLIASIFTIVLLASAGFSQTARLQVIHNSADPAAETVDVYLYNNSADQVVIKLDDFAFRSATPFVDAPAGDELSAIFAAPASSGPDDQVITTIALGALAENETYVAVANGVVAEGFAANPDGASIAFTVFAYGDIREAAADSIQVEFVVMHGSTDAPAVDVTARGVAKIVDDAKYGDATGYIGVPQGEYLLDVTPADDADNTLVGTFKADLSGLNGAAAFVFASGFLNPAANNDGPAFGIFAALPNGDVVEFPAQTTARLQVIHNSADPAAATVDVYLYNNDADETVIKLDDFAFRSATAFVDAPAQADLSAIFAAPSSTGPEDQVVTTVALGSLTPAETYIAVANGIIGEGFAANPDGREIGFTVFAFNDIREAAADDSQVEFVVLHGASDAPGVDVTARDVAKIVDDAAYGDLTSYIGVPADSYLLDITPADDNNNTLVGTFKADLSGLQGGAAVVFASGFLSPADNNNGPAFGLFAALPSGDVVEFPAQTTARLQVIHNSADPAAATVDVYLYNNDADETVIKLDDFAFRSATAFVDAPAQADLSAIFAAPSSTGPEDQVVTTIALGSLVPAETYVAIANGVIGDGFAENPNGKDISFTVFAFGDMREQAANESDVNFAIFHGATDAPAVDVIARGVTELAGEVQYGAITEYIAVPAAPYTIDIAASGSEGTIVKSFGVNLSNLGGGAAVVFASGFLNPSGNNDGPAFGLYAALPSGDVVGFPVLATARLQVIHNAADPAANSVDIYLYNDSGDSVIVKLDDFSFQGATPFIDAPANAELSAIVALRGSTGPENGVVTTKSIGALLGGETYIAVANGVISPGNFEENPDGRDRAFSLLINTTAREQADSADVDLLVLHGATDAPTVDVVARGVGVLVDNAAYGDFSNYISVSPGAYVLDITPGNDNSTVVASFDADLSGLGGESLVVMASGFLSPENDNNGESFGLIAITADGQSIPLSVVSSLEKDALTAPKKFSLEQNYPNPFNPTTVIRFAVPRTQEVKLNVYDINGRLVGRLVNGSLNAGEYEFTFDASGLGSGIYFYRIEAGSFVQTKRMTLIK